MNIPDYQTFAGLRSRSGSIGKQDLRYCVVSTTAEECRAYARQLEDLGFVKHTEREAAGNLFYTFCKEDQCLFVFYNHATQTVYLTAEPNQPLPQPMESCTGEASLTQMQIGGGMSYVVQLCDGSFVCIDGGSYQPEDEQRLYEFLKANSAAKPKIAMWLFTHSHSDHIQLAAHFMAAYADAVEIEAVAYQFPDCSKISVEAESTEKMGQDIQRFEAACQGKTVCTLHTGQVYGFPGMELEVLRSLDDTYLLPYFSFNDLSATFRLKFSSGKTALLLGDCMQRECRELMHTYGSHLRSDILQVSHHGLVGGDKDLYMAADPEICFWPVSEAVFSGHYDGPYQYCLGEGGCNGNAYLRDDTIRKRIHYHAGETATVNV